MRTVEDALGNIGESFRFAEHDIDEDDDRDSGADTTSTRRRGIDIEEIEDPTKNMSGHSGTLDAAIRGSGISSTRALPDTVRRFLEYTENPDVLGD